MTGNKKLTIEEFSKSNLNWKGTLEAISDKDKNLKLNVEEENKLNKILIELKPNFCYLKTNTFDYRKNCFNIKLSSTDELCIKKMKDEFINICYSHNDYIFDNPDDEYCSYTDPSGLKFYEKTKPKNKDEIEKRIKNMLYTAKSKTGETYSGLNLKITQFTKYKEVNEVNGKKMLIDYDKKKLMNKSFVANVVFSIESIFRREEKLYPQLHVSYIIVKEINQNQNPNEIEIDINDLEYL